MHPRIKHKRALDTAHSKLEKGDYEGAAKQFKKAIQILPSDWEAYFGLGVATKWLCRWEECLKASTEAAERHPDFVGSWWNIGIAATALSKWRLAREGWSHAPGVDMEINNDPVQVNLGSVPIRLKTTNNEVVWCERLDPARVRIINVPTPESGHRCRDLLINDGEPVGSRMSGGQEVPVFNELQILESSGLGTFEMEIENISREEAETLEALSDERVRIEDWSTLRYICRKCSEGVPHDHHDNDLREAPEEKNTRRFGIAASREEDIEEVLAKWERPETAKVGNIECLVEPV